jgi:hypothetical protein
VCNGAWRIITPRACKGPVTVHVGMASTSSTPEPKRSRRRWFQDLGDKLNRKLHISPRSKSQPSPRQSPRSSPRPSPRPSLSRIRSRSPAHSSSPGFRNAAWSVLETTLEGLKISAQLVPPVQSAISNLASFLSLFEVSTRRLAMTQTMNRGRCARRKLQDIVETMKSWHPISPSQPNF